MKIECPNCDAEIDVTDKLPSRACDDEEYNCDCGCVITFGWYATAELRGHEMPKDNK
jgi:hypothetical protein